MNSCSWIFCERGGRWTPAMRLILENDRTARHRVREVRHLGELAAEVATRPASIVAIEVPPGNFAESLDWLAQAARDYPRAGCVVLCDREIQSPSVAVALREAGALEIASSPRRLRSLVELGLCHAEAVADRVTLAAGSDTLSLTAPAWASPPWQDA